MYAPNLCFALPNRTKLEIKGIKMIKKIINICFVVRVCCVSVSVDKADNSVMSRNRIYCYNSSKALKNPTDPSEGGAVRILLFENQSLGVPLVG